MMPHPTMTFAWEEGVQRCSSRLLGAFMIAVFALFAASLLFGHVPHSSPVVAEQQATDAISGSSATVSVDPKQHAVIPGEDTRISIEQQDGA
jgi:hypothetical protein